MVELWAPSSTPAIDPSSFFDTVLRLTGEEKFDETKDHDGHEFLVYILGGLHNELNVPGFADSDDDTNAVSDNADSAWARHVANNDSIFVETFGGQEASVTKCDTKCGHTTRTFVYCDIVTLPIPKVKQEVKLVDCLADYYKEESLETQKLCPGCQHHTPTTKQMRISKPPPVLVLQLKRFQNDLSKIAARVTCPVFDLDMTPYMSESCRAAASNGAKDTVYNLYGVVSHSVTETFGHYIALIRHPLSGQWNCYDDHKVTPVDINALKIKMTEAYLLFYERRSSEVQQIEEISHKMKDFPGESQQAIELRTGEDLEGFVNDAEPGIIGFFAKGSSDTSRVLVKLADLANEGVRLAHTFSAEVLIKYPLYQDDIVVFRPDRLQTEMEPNQVVFTGDSKSLSDLKDWVSVNLHGLVGYRTSRNIAQFQLPLITVYFDEDLVRTTKQLNALRVRIMKVAEKFVKAGENVTFAVSKSTDLEHELRDLELSDVDDHVVVATDMGDRRFLLTGKFSMRTLKTFVDSFLDGSLVPLRKSEPVPASNDEAVKVVVGRTFDEMVTDIAKDVLILFYSPFSTACNVLAPKYEELARQLEDEPDLLIARMDATANDIPDLFKVLHYPAVFLVRRKKKQSPLQYEGGQEVDDFIQYLAHSTTTPLRKFTRDGQRRLKKGGSG